MAAAVSSSISDHYLLALKSHGHQFSLPRHRSNVSLSFTQKSVSMSSLKVQSQRENGFGIELKCKECRGHFESLRTQAAQHLIESLTKAEGMRFGIVVARFNEIVTRQLLEGALETFKRYAVKEEDIDVVWVPGSFEFLVVAQELGKSRKYQAVICIGAVIRGDTTHYNAMANSAASGVQSAALNSGVPCIFCVLTCENLDQAINRAGGKAGNKGSEAALSAIEMASLFDHHLKVMEKTEPSKVIHVRNVGHEISENDLLQLFQPFGVITKLLMLRAKNQALLQMQDISSAIDALQFHTNVQPSIRGRIVYIQFSSHQELVDQNTQGRGDEPNRILLVTIRHMPFPITVELLLQVFSPHGFVEKIVTFQKSAGFQAFIQYQLQQCAVSARNSLQGSNICDCSQLDIQFSNRDELQVSYNNDWSWDFTNPSLPSKQKGRSYHPGFGDVGVGYPQVPNSAAIAAAFRGGLPPGVSGKNDRCTVLVSNLNSDRIDEDKLFNLFSIYGNIVRIKLLRNKPGHALVHMGDGFQAKLAIHFLEGAKLFGKRLDVNFSKHPNIITRENTHEYSKSYLNRFNHNAARNYRYCCSPSKMIHVSSLPQDVTDEEIIAHLEEHGNIVNSKLFGMNGKKQALVLFENREQATEALVCKHATSLGGSTIRISFSQFQTIYEVSASIGT